jgi:hypothetical protein
MARVLHSRPDVRGRAARPRGKASAILSALLIASAILFAVASCGTSGGATAMPIASTAPATTSPTSASPAAGGGSVDCAAIRRALEVQNLAMQLLLQATSDGQWAAMLDPKAPVRLDAKAYSDAIETIATLPGTGDVIGTFREIATQFRAAAASGKPYGDGSGAGEKLHKLVADNFVDAQAALSVARESAGCR